MLSSLEDLLAIVGLKVTTAGRLSGLHGTCSETWKGEVQILGAATLKLRAMNDICCFRIFGVERLAFCPNDVL